MRAGHVAGKIGTPREQAIGQTSDIQWTSIERFMNEADVASWGKICEEITYHCLTLLAFTVNILMFRVSACEHQQYKGRGTMGKGKQRQSLAITEAARSAGRHLAIAGPLANYMSKLTDNQRSEDFGTFTGVIVRHGKITDVVASTGAVKIEE
jgi:hypothetical protein